MCDIKLRRTPVSNEFSGRTQIVRHSSPHFYLLSNFTCPIVREFISSIILSRVLFENILLRIMNISVYKCSVGAHKCYIVKVQLIDQKTDP